MHTGRAGHSTRVRHTSQEVGPSGLPAPCLHASFTHGQNDRESHLQKLQVRMPTEVLLIKKKSRFFCHCPLLGYAPASLKHKLKKHFSEASGCCRQQLPGRQTCPRPRCPDPAAPGKGPPPPAPADGFLHSVVFINMEPRPT